MDVQENNPENKLRNHKLCKNRRYKKICWERRAQQMLKGAKK